LPRRIYYLVKNVAPSQRDILENITQTTNYRKKVEVRKSYPVSDAEPRTDLSPYRAYLSSMAGIARARGVRVLFMTQQTTWNAEDPRAEEWHWLTLLNGTRYDEQKLDRAMARYNAVMVDVAEEMSVPVLDLTRSIPKSLDFFYDDVHFNVRGAEVAGKLLAGLIRIQVLTPSRHD
jgi:hypothetical protein